MINNFRSFHVSAASDDPENFNINNAMAQDRTFVPGIDDASKSDFMYARTSSSSGISTASMSGTVVPGMVPQSGGKSNPPFEAKQESQKAVSGLPVVGFLYSISNQGIPEYWPLVLGYNSIGRNADNTVVLNEQTVSGIHASISIQKKRNDDIDAVVRIEQGRTGLLLNDEDVDLQYGSRCKNGDVITIGSNYKMIIIIINAKASGLSVAENFISTQPEEEDVFDRKPQAPRTIGGAGTISLDGSDMIEAPGETRFM